MPIVINTNLNSITAQRSLETVNRQLTQSIQRLSSGLRINSARDDASGLVIATRLTSQIRGLNAAVRNLSDGISLVQTAEGGVSPITGAMSSSTWAWDGSNWATLPVVGASPSPRHQASMVWDSSRGVCVMHGGIDSNGALLDETWEFDGAAWTLAARNGPGARRLGSMAFDRLRGMAALFGGSSSLGGGAATTLGDTWTYGPSYAPFGAGCAGSAGSPSLSSLAGPRAGQTFVPTLTNLVPSMPIAILALGFSDTVWQGAPLPLDMTMFGIPGCSLLVAADRIDVIAAQNGIAQQLLPIPADPAFVGVFFYQQGFSFEVPGFNAFGGVLSDAARARSGL